MAFVVVTVMTCALAANAKPKHKAQKKPAAVESNEPVAEPVFTTPAPLDPPKDYASVPKSGNEVEDFIPVGFTVESSVEGDLVRGGRLDVALVLRGPTAVDDTTPRVLIVLSRGVTGITLIGKSDKLLVCGGCGGVRDSEPSLTVEKGTLVVEQTGGAREMWGAVHRFRMDGKLHRLVLVGLDRTLSFDTLTLGAVTTSENYLTGVGEKKTEPPQVEALRELGEDAATLAHAKEAKPQRTTYAVPKATVLVDDVTFTP